MKNTIIGIALLLVVAVGTSFTSAQTKSKSGPALMASIRSEKSSYGINDNLRLQIQLKNVGTTPLLLCRAWAWGVGRTQVRVFDANGKEVFTDFLADELPPPPRKEDFLELHRGEFFGTQLDEPAKHFVRSPGTYEIVVEYTSAVSEVWARKYVQLPSLPLWSRERGTTVSNRITVTVTE